MDDPNVVMLRGLTDEEKAAAADSKGIELKALAD